MSTIVAYGIPGFHFYFSPHDFQVLMVLKLSFNWLTTYLDFIAKGCLDP